MRKTPVSEVLPKLKAHVIEQWAGDKAFTVLSAGRALGLTPARGGVASPINYATKHLAAAGIATVVQYGNGDRRSFPVWNWTGQSAAAQTLGTAVDAFLSAPVGARSGAPVRTSLADGRTIDLMPVADADRQLVKEALRRVVAARLDLPAVAERADSALVKLCALLPAADIRLLPAVALTLASPKRSEYARAVRLLMRWAGANDVVAMYLRPYQQASAWLEWLDAYVPLPATTDAAYDSVCLVRRETLYLYKACERLLQEPLPESPHALSVISCNKVLRAVADDPKQSWDNTRLETALRRLGHLGLGPWRELKALKTLRFVEGTWTPAFNLASAEGSPHSANSWAGVRHAVTAHQLPDQWLEFLTWYELFSTAPLRELRKQWGVSYQRKDVRLLTPSTIKHRHRALRAYIGAALNLLGWSRERCTPFAIFGAGMEVLTQAITEAYAAIHSECQELRAKGIAPPRGREEHDTTAPSMLTVNGGMFAEALATWMRSSPTGRPDSPSPETLETLEKSYRWAMGEHRIEFGRAEGRRRRKDVRAIVADVPSLALLAGSLKSVQRRVESAERQASIRSVADMAQTHIIAVIVAIGSTRAGEPGAMRLSDVSLSTDFRGNARTRYALVPAARRKGGKAKSTDHEVALIEELVPEWLWNFHHERGRSALMAPWVASGKAPHDGLFVARDGGGALGGALENFNPAQGSRLVNNYFKNWRVDQLRLQGFTVVPGGYGHHAPHAERSRVQKLMGAADVPDWHREMLLGHRPRTTAGKSYTESMADLNAGTVRRMLEVLSDGDARAASVARTPKSHRSADADLGGAVRSLIIENIDNLSPKEIATIMLKLAEGARLADTLSDSARMR